jgi:UPF0271 protein
MGLKQVDLNCDMGEGFGQWKLSEAPDEALMELITSANVATGFHAGDPNHMDRLTRLAREHGVALGAHPGFADLQGFGRRAIRARPDELVNDVLYQLGALREFGRRYGVTLQHVKPHGALYMEAAASPELSRALVDALGRTFPEGIIFCMGGSATEIAARDAGYKVAREFYADRDYDRSGSIVFARQVGRPDPDAVARKCLRACQKGVVDTVEGDTIPIAFESICFHSDTPGALEIGRAIRATLTDNGIALAPAAAVVSSPAALTESAR